MAHLQEFCIPVENVGGRPQLIGRDIVCYQCNGHQPNREFYFLWAHRVEPSAIILLYVTTEHIQAVDRNMRRVTDDEHHLVPL